MLSARQKLRFLNGGCDTYLTKERSVPVRTREHVLSLTGYVGEKLYIDLVSMSDTIRGNGYLLTAEDSFSRYCRAYSIPNKEARTVAKVLMDQHFNIYGLPDQLHSDNGNPVERFHRSIIAMLRTRGDGRETCWRKDNQRAYKSMREVQGGRVRPKALTQNIQAGCLLWYLDPLIIPGTSHKLRSFWAGPYRVSRLIAPALAEIKPVYYPGEEKLVGLEVLKLYRGEDVIHQDAEDINPDRWLDEGELTELPEATLGEAERRNIEPSLNQRNPEIPPEPALEIQIILKDPEEIAVRDGIHERIQAEIHQGNKEEEGRAEEMLEVPPELNEVPDLMMEEEDVLPEATGSTKRRGEEVSRGQRKRGRKMT